MLEKLKKLRDAHLKLQGIKFYKYQTEFSDKILEALVLNHEAVQSCDPKKIEELEVIEIPVEFSRQSGKTTAVVHTVECLMLYFPMLTRKNLSIGIFAPQKEQAKTDFDRLKSALYKSGRFHDFDPIEANAQTLRIPCPFLGEDYLSECYIFPITPTSHAESKTLDLMIFEESQSLNDQIMISDIYPMGKTTNAPRIFIGTAGTQINYFYKLIQNNKALIYDCDLIIKMRREQYEIDGNLQHLVYERSVNADRILLGEESDEFTRPYKLKWIIGTGQFLTWERLDCLVGSYSRCYQGDKSSQCFAGIDTAKNPDSTVVTILRKLKEPIKKVINYGGAQIEVTVRNQIINWLELKGDNYQDQFDIIMDFLSRFNIVAIALDATGQGDFMPDMFERHSQWNDEMNGLYRVKFSASSKDIMYKNLMVSLMEFLTEIPKIDTKEAEKFRQQMLDLQKEYRGELLNCHHPDIHDAHDDYPDSWALAEYAKMMFDQQPQVDIKFL